MQSIKINRETLKNAFKEYINNMNSGSYDYYIDKGMFYDTCRRLYDQVKNGTEELQAQSAIPFMTIQNALTVGMSLRNRNDSNACVKALMQLNANKSNNSIRITFTDNEPAVSEVKEAIV